MKIGCCTNMLTSSTGVGIEFIRPVVLAGFDYIELPLYGITALDNAEFTVLTNALKNSGIGCETSNCACPPGLRLTGPKANFSEAGAYFEKAFIRAEILGIECLSFGAGGAKHVPEGFPLEAGYVQVAEFLQHIQPLAAKHGVLILIEPLRVQECNLINTYREAHTLMKKVNCSNVKLLVDYYHMRVMSEKETILSECGGELLKHVHFAKIEGRRFPIDIEEDSRYASFAAELKKIDYDARVSLEAYTDDFDAEAPLAVKVMRDIFA